MKRVIFALSILGFVGYFVARPVSRVVKNEMHSTLPVRAKVDAPSYKAHSVQFGTDDGLTIKGTYANGTNGATILLLHGYGASREQLEPVAKLLNKHGYGVLSFDTRAHGESEGELIGFGENEVLDLKAALDWLEKRNIDHTKIGAFGFSMGAFILAREAAHDTRIQSLILASVPSTASHLSSDSDGGGLHGFVTGQLRMITDEFMGVSAYGMGILETIEYISPRPILILGGALDSPVPQKRVEQVYNAAKEPKQLVIFPDSGHGDYREKHKELFEKIVLDHFQKTLFTSKVVMDHHIKN